MGYPARAHLGDDNGISLGPKWDFSGHPYGPQKFVNPTLILIWGPIGFAHAFPIYIYLYIYVLFINLFC